MQTKYKLNRSLFIFGLTILLFGAVCPLVQAQTSSNDIVFERSRDGNFNSPEIYTMKADGSNQTNLTNSAANNDYLPDWSPDGSRIAFVRSSGIWVMNADGGNRIQLTNAGDSRPSWSPNGGKIAFSRNSANGADIYVMNADGSNPVKLTAAANGERSDAPRWSPDATRIVFFSTRTQTGSDQEIYVMNADGTNQTALTNNTTLDVVPDWSPDGSKITFTAIRSGNNLEIYVMNADGSNQTRITNNPAFDAESSWSPDGTKLVFETERDGNREIYTMNADGSNPVRLTNNAVPDETPRWKRNRAVVPRAVLYDYFGTGKSDYLLFNYDDRAIRWDILRNPVTNPAQIRHTFWGFTGYSPDPYDFQMLGDYDGDLKMDVGTWRVFDPAHPQQAYFYIQRSSDPNPNAVYAQQWGLDYPTDNPVNGDFDGDGKNDFTVVREESDNSVWYVLPSSGGGFRAVRWGAPTDFAVPFGYDYNGDGRDDLIVIRTDAATGNMTFYIGDALTGTSILTQQWGNANAAQGGVVFYFVGNYLGDSRADVGIYYGACPANPTCEIGGSWWFKETGSTNYTVTKFGRPLNLNPFEGDFPSDGDYDGDGKLDITVYRPENSTFYSRLSSNGQLKAQYFDGISATPPANTKMLETALLRGKPIPASAFKAVMISKQPDGTFKMERVSDFYLNR